MEISAMGEKLGETAWEELVGFAGAAAQSEDFHHPDLNMNSLGMQPCREEVAFRH